MNIVGQGHQSIVIADTADSVKKFYLSETEALREQEQLSFIAIMQQDGLDLGCAISKLLEVIGAGAWRINDKTYGYCIRLERIPGANAKQVSSRLNFQQTEALGRDLGNISFNLHTQTMTYRSRWKRKFTNNGKELLDHLLEDKAWQVLNEEPDRIVKAKVKAAANYLRDRYAHLNNGNTLNHRDLSLSNVLVSADGRANGLVDWSSFGLAHPSLSLYELIYEPVWPYVKSQYEQRGGSLEEDIAYAAAIIHLAWAPIISKQLGIPLHESETRDAFEAMHEKFQALTG